MYVGDAYTYCTANHDSFSSKARVAKHVFLVDYT